MPMNMIFERKLPLPVEVKAAFPLPQSLADRVAERDREIKDILSGRSDRLLLIIGPCSADREDSVLEYMTRLSRLAERVAERILILPRLYTGKPRTTGDGYKGLLHQPDPTGRPDLLRGVIATRELHLAALRETGLSCADEMLYPENLKYVDDLLAYVAIGARSVEDQEHRLVASGLTIPVGMKNPTGGDLSVMLNAIHTAQRGHSFIYRGWAVHSSGNPYAHAVLRGFVDTQGLSHGNYGEDTLDALQEAYAAAGLAHPAVLIDANHANSGKDALRQPDILRDVLAARNRQPSWAGLLRGFLVESYLVDGHQPVTGRTYGQSITDPCLGWDKTERLVLEMAEYARG